VRRLVAAFTVPANLQSIIDAIPGPKKSVWYSPLVENSARTPKQSAIATHPAIDVILSEAKDLRRERCLYGRKSFAEQSPSAFTNSDSDARASPTLSITPALPFLEGFASPLKQTACALLRKT
jgi:hypothetical protein